jgi:hypothetical protein
MLLHDPVPEPLVEMVPTPLQQTHLLRLRIHLTPNQQSAMAAEQTAARLAGSTRRNQGA